LVLRTSIIRITENQMKYLGIILILSLFAISCKKNEEPLPVPGKDPNLIEEYTYDSTGVVFKIINDVERAWNAIPSVDSLQKADSLAFGKFDYPGTSTGNYFIYNRKYYTWFTKKGQYVCWRYKYIDDVVNYRFDRSVKYYNVYIPYHKDEVDYIGCCTFVYTDIAASKSELYPSMFPLVNDTVTLYLTHLYPSGYLTDYK
jgi:hypothetical protein